MKNFIKRSLTFMLTVLCLASMSMTAFATEVKPTGDCRLTFSVTDKTNGIFIDEITITLMNLSTNVEYNYTVTSLDYLFGTTVDGSVKQGEYNIALNYPSKGQFAVQNADGTAITSFSANNNAHTFDWVVVSNEGEDAAKPQTNSSETKANEFIAKTDNAEADEAWNTFMDSVSVLETDDKYAAILKFYETTKDVYARNYEKVVASGKAEDYLNMTSFEKFVWYTTYVTPVMATTYSDYDTYFGTVDKWNSNVVGEAFNLLKNQKATEQAEAYKTLMEWQYNYFKENASIYNFMTGQSSKEENSTLETVSPDSANGNDGDPTDEEIQSLIDEENKSNKDAEKEKGIWSDTADLIKGNAFTIAILLILVGATIGVIIYRKRKTIDDDSNE